MVGERTNMKITEVTLPYKDRYKAHLKAIHIGGFNEIGRAHV